jgi:hypothetical protein
MKLAEVSGKVETSVVFERNNFRILASKKAFEILSSGLYSDKISAIIRELSTNAADSHKSTNQQLPFEVHLPNTLEPFFHVRDLGSGLSDEDINGIYTTYFDSNRNNSNDYTGCMGLGSKSPFSYTDQFTVESRFNNTKNIYNCFINENGIPDVVRLTSAATKDANGLTIKFPVKPDDFLEFSTKASNILSIFNPRPIVKGSGGFKFKDYEYIYKTSGFMLAKTGGRGSNIVMGNVAYPITAGDITDLDHHVVALLSHGVEIFIDIGAVEVAASREKLQFTLQTTQYIKNKLDEIVEELRVLARDFVKTAKTIWEARRKLSDYKNNIIGRFIDNKVSWNGIQISPSVKLEDYYRTAVVEKLEISQYAKVPWKDPKHYPVSQVIASDIPIILNTSATGGYTRTAHYLHTINKHSAYIITPIHSDYIKTNINNLPDLAASGIYEEAIDGNKLPVTPVAARTSRGGKAYSVVYQFNSDKRILHSPASDWWTKLDYDMSVGGIYTELMRFYCIKLEKCASPDRQTHPAIVNTILDKLAACDKKITLYGIRPADAEKRKKYASKWISLFEYINNFYITSSALNEQVCLADSLLDISDYQHIARIKLGAGFRNNKPRSTFEDFVCDVEQAIKYSTDNKVKTYRSLLEMVGIEIKSDKKDYFQKFWTRLRERYPVVSYIDWMEAAKNGKTILDYIKLVETSLKGK